MQFRTSSTTSPYFQSPFQRRMLGYVGLIALCMLAFQLFATKRPNIDPAVKAPTAEDYQVRPETRPQLEPGEFLAVPETIDPAARRQRGLARDPNNVDIDPDWLTGIEDNTLGIRPIEAESFFFMLDRARQVPKETLLRAAESGTQYLNLMSDPQIYRGKPVTLVGEMWRLYEFQAEDNDYGLERLYEAWLFTSDSGSHPLRVVCSKLGPDLKTGDSQRTPVRITGYFFKREGYNSKGGLHVAPTILGGELERYVSAQAVPASDHIAPIMLGVIVGIGLILGVTIISFAWNDRRNPQQSYGRMSKLTAETAEKLALVDARSVKEQLRDLEDEERLREWTAGLTPAPEPTPPEPPLESPTPPPPTRPRSLVGFDE